MDAMLQRHCARYIYVVPDGLRELMSDISREVIRSQPEFIYTFIADYVDALMITRENARVAARMVQSITEISSNIIQLLMQAGIARTNAEKLSNSMQDTFRKYIDVKIGDKGPDMSEQEIIQEILDSTGFSQRDADKAAIVIQQAYRDFKEKKDREKELLTGMIDWRVAARSAIQLYRRTGVSADEANRAATMIKAAYKGYYTRKFMRRLAEEAAHIFDAEDADSGSSSSEDTLEPAITDLDKIPELAPTAESADAFAAPYNIDEHTSYNVDEHTSYNTEEHTSYNTGDHTSINVENSLDDIPKIMNEILDIVVTQAEADINIRQQMSRDLLVAANRVSGRDITDNVKDALQDETQPSEESIGEK